MSFKDTILPDFVIAELYGSMLIQTSEAAAAAPLPGTKPELKTDEIFSKKDFPGKKIIKAENLPGLPSSKDNVIALSSVKETENLTESYPLASALPSVDTYRYLGKNQKKVAIIARYTHDPYIPEQHLEFLTKLLSACKLNLGDVAIINDSVQAVNFSKLHDELAPKFVLLFDITPGEIGLPLSFPLLKAQSFSDCVFLYGPSIADLLPSTPEVVAIKKTLWASLQKMFL